MSPKQRVLACPVAMAAPARAHVTEAASVDRECVESAVTVFLWRQGGP